MTPYLIFSGSTLLLIFAFSSALFPQEVHDSKYYADRIEFGTVEVKRNVLQELRRLETSEASRIAVAGLQDQSPVIRATAVSATVKLPPAEAYTALEPILRDPSAFVRKEAVIAIGVTGAVQSADTIIAMLEKDKDTGVRSMAVVTLGRLGTISAIGPLVRILRRKPKSKHRFLRRAAARSIGQIAEISSNRTPTTTTPENFLSEEFKSTPHTGVSTSPLFQSAINVLKKVLNNKREVSDTKRESAFALGAIGDDAAIAILRQNLTSKDYYLSEISREALLKIGQQ